MFNTKMLKKYQNNLRNLLVKNGHYLFLLVLAGFFIYLRYYHIQFEGNTGYDQARDAFAARDVVKGKFPLQGPWTGNGHLHIGPLYYYLLGFFFYIFNLDPIASNYLNIIFNIFNFFAIYFILSKLTTKRAALFGILVFTFSKEYILAGRTAWNVSPMIGLGALIFYGIIQIYKGHFHWFYVVAVFAGLYFHAHFTAIFLPVIILLSLFFLKNKKTALKYIVFSIPLYLMWFVPNILSEILHQNSDGYRYREFVQYFYHGFHLRFFFYRLPYHFILFNKIFSIGNNFFQLAIPLVYLFYVLIFEKNKQEKLIGYIIFMFFLVPILGFTVYAGPISEYYYNHAVITVFYVLIYLQKRLLQINYKVLLTVLAIFWLVNFYVGTKDLWIKKSTGGLQGTKEGTRAEILQGKKIPFDIGHMDSYLYTIWKEDTKRY